MGLSRARVLSLPQAIHKMTGLPARRLNLKNRGLIREGAKADLVVFDARRIADAATYQDPHRYPGGIDHVVVTGIGHARNLAVVASGDSVIAVGGRWGTLAEIGFARVMGRYVVILEPGWEIDELPRAATPEEAVELALAALR